MLDNFNCGHARTPDNIRREGKKHERCKECHNAAQRERQRDQASRRKVIPLIELLGKRPARIVPSRVISQEW